MMTSSPNFWRQFKIFKSIYYHTKLQVTGTNILDFKGAGGAESAPPPTIKGTQKAQPKSG